MSEPKPTTTAAPKAGQAVSGFGQTASDKDAGQAEMQAQADQEAAQGFAGTEVDQTPNQAYTLAGVTSGAPTPETDEAAKKAATGDTAG
jgi:hypothetical protein